MRNDGRLVGAALGTHDGRRGYLQLTRLAAEAGVGPLALVTWRAGIGALVVGIASAVRIATGRPTFAALGTIPRQERALLLGGVLSGALLNIGIFVAFTRISIALTLLIFYLYPTLVAVVSATRFGEPFDRIRSVALGASLVGLLLVFAGASGLGPIDPLGVGLAFLAALAQMYYVLAARHGFANVPAPQAATITMGGGALLYLLAAVAIGALPAIGQPLGTTSGIAAVLFAGTIGAGVPTLAFIMGIRRLGPPRAAILATLEPVVGVALAAAILAEVPTSLQVLGGILVIAGGVLSQLGGRGASAEHEAVVPPDGAP